MPGTLKQRVLTALVLVPPLIAALFLLPPAGVAILFGAFVAVAAWEWAALSTLAGAARWSYLALVLALGGALIAFAGESRALVHAVLAVATVWWLAVLLQLGARARLFHSRRGRLLAGVVTLVPAWVALAALHAHDPRSPWLVLFVLLLVAVADVAAYAAGHAFGRTKLAPAVSPGKTVEGVIGGAAAVMLVAYFCGTMIWRFEGPALGAWITLATVAGLVSVIGDLSESKLKRIAGVKDSGKLLPGHGGVLDRIDALTAAAPTFAWGWWLFFNPRG